MPANRQEVCMSTRRESPSPDILLDIIQKKYPLEDFSQQAINRGQRSINGDLTELGKTLARTLQALKDAIKKSSIGSEIDCCAIQNDITKAIAISERVAGYYPPGCNYIPLGGGTGGGGGGDT
jgi:hypothetical protein